MGMLLKNEFEIDADADRAWALLTDLAQVMPCMPGATLEGVEGENYLGAVKVKVGPIGAHFRGTAHFAQKDDATHSAVIVAAGKDPKGQAAANAQIHARLEPVTAGRTRVLIDADLDISGRMAQFGRGAIADVSNRLIGQFVANISALLEAGQSSSETVAATGATPSAGSAAAPRGSFSTTEPPALSPPTESGGSMDLVGLVGPMLRERYGQAIAGGLGGLALSWLLFGRHVHRERCSVCGR